MKQKTLQKKLLAGETVCISDDFDEAAIRLVYDGKSTKAFIKRPGRSEKEIPQSNETVCEIILSGKEIPQSSYDKY